MSNGEGGDEIIIPGVDNKIFMPESDVVVNLSVDERRRIEEVMEHGWKLTPATMAYKISRGKWIPARHLKYISHIIASEIAKGDARIIVTMPARHGKSEFLSVNTPIWFLEHWPHKYVMNLTYGLDLATDFSLKIRTAFQDEGNHHLLSTRLNKDKQTIARFLTSAGGGVTAAGLGGIITGRGADLMLIDDFIKNAEEALSETQKNTTWEWFKSVAYTRLEPGASVVILATRWAQDDLIGRCLDELGHENWLVINLPALAVHNDPLGRAPGEALWPERYPEKRLRVIEKTLGSYWWNAMYQQDPKASMAGLDLGERLKVIDGSELPNDIDLVTVRAWDLASQENAGDWTAGPRYSYHKPTGRYIIEDMQRVQKGPHGIEQLVNTVAQADGHGIPIWAEQEPGSSGKIVMDHYRRNVVPGYNFSGDKPSGRIEVRAGPFLAAVEAGLVSMVRAPWNADLKKELNAFPDATHDDQVSALGLAHNHLSAGQFQAAVWGRGREYGGKVMRTRRAYMNTGEQPASRLTWGRR